MTFSFLEYHIIVFSASLIIFSLAIKTQINQQFIELMNNLDWINKELLKNKKVKGQQKIRINETLRTYFDIFGTSLKKISSYIYHTFYIIFLFSAIGIFASLFIETDMFLFPVFNNCILWLYTNIIPVISMILLYFLIRGTFLLICFSKIDNEEYVGKIYNKLITRVKDNFENLMDEEHYKPMGKFKVFLLWFLFLIFFVRDKTFKQFYYNFYKI
jgi:hypothetical protein